MEEKDIIVDEITIDTVGEVETDTLEIADTCDIDTLEVGEIVGKALTLNSLNFDPKDGELTYGENVAVYTGKFAYTTTDAPDKEFEIDGSIAFNIKALNNVVLDASEDGKTLEIHLDQAFLTKVDNLDLNKADKASLTALTEIVEQVRLAQSADAIAIVGLQSDVLTIKETIKNLATFSVKIVSELPTTDISTTTIYLVAKTDTQNNDYFDEFLYVDNKWEKIGTTKVDFANYYTKSEVNAKLGEIDADILDLQDQIDDINTDNLVDLETNQEIGGVKTFKNQVGFKNEDGTIDYIKHINNNLLITTSTGANLLNIDEGLSRVYFFNKEIAFKEDIAESSGTTVRVGGVAVAEFDADSKADASTVEQQGTKVTELDAKLVSLATQVATDYYNKTDADGKFATTEAIDEITESLTSIEDGLTNTDDKLADMQDELRDKVSESDFENLQISLGTFKEEVALDYYKKTDVDTKLTALFDRTTASSTGGINTKCGFKIAGADGREMIVNIMTITSSSVHNFAIPFTTGYNYSNSLEYNGGNFRGERLYFSTRTLTGVAISSFSGPVHCIFVGY